MFIKILVMGQFEIRFKIILSIPFLSLMFKKIGIHILQYAIK